MTDPLRGSVGTTTRRRWSATVARACRAPDRQWDYVWLRTAQLVVDRINGPIRDQLRTRWREPR